MTTNLQREDSSMNTQVVKIKLSTWLPIKNIFPLYLIAWIILIFVIGLITGYQISSEGLL